MWGGVSRAERSALAARPSRPTTGWIAKEPAIGFKGPLTKPGNPPIVAPLRDRDRQRTRVNGFPVSGICRAILVNRFPFTSYRQDRPPPNRQQSSKGRQRAPLYVFAALHQRVYEDRSPVRVAPPADPCGYPPPRRYPQTAPRREPLRHRVARAGIGRCGSGFVGTPARSNRAHGGRHV